MRPDAMKIVILLTDGVQNPTTYGVDGIEDPAVVAKRLRDQGVKVLAVGISPDIDEKELEQITADPENVFYANNFDELDSYQFVDQVTGLVCTSTFLFCSDNIWYNLGKSPFVP